jgi:hypothetical protein
MEITNISQLDPTQFINQDYKVSDESLLNSLNINKEFGLPEDKVEVHVISPNGEILNSVYDFKNYTTRQTIQGTSLYDQVELDPKSDLESFGINLGKYEVVYNFYRQLFFSSPATPFFISQISSDRTEIKISNNSVSYTDLGQSYLTFISERNSRAFYSDFLLNFGDNKTIIGVNIAFDNSNESYASLYIKLYEPLPSNFRLKDTLWIVESISEPYVFEVNTEFIAEATPDTTSLRGPNINIGLVEKANLTTPYLNLSSLLNSSVSSSYQQLQSWLEEKSIEITVDYTDFSNFVHFSSARERLENFKYKLNLIQSLQSDINNINNLSISSSVTYTSASVLNLQNQINTLIEKFDGYEYFLYYESGSYSWPKSGSNKPYTNLTSSNPESLVWFGSTDYTSPYYGGAVVNADNYDIENKNYIWNNFPEYIKEDSQNSNLELFSAMLGQHYDYIWTYIKDITDLQVADNRIDFGISKDLVADTLRNFGMKLYTNSRNQEDLYLSLLGIDSNNSTLPSTGSYMINTYVTASNNTIPDNDIVKETYKRIYHNLPYLLKTKGTRRGLRSLINCFGIPDTILKVKEYGGNRKDLDIIEQITPKFNYKLDLNGKSYVRLPFRPSYKQYLDTGLTILPDTIEYRFKLNHIYPTQSILESNYKHIKVTQTSGSFADVSFGLSDGNSFLYSTPINIPIYNDDWWVLNLTRETGSLDANSLSTYTTTNTYTLTIGNKNDYGIQYLNSSSITIDGATQFDYNLYGWNTVENLNIGNTNFYSPTSASVQEVRVWIDSIPLDNFKDHILNPIAYPENSVTGSYDKLIFRYPFGSELDNVVRGTYTTVHPAQTASFGDGSSVIKSTINLINFSSAKYSTNHETFLVNTPNLGSITEIDEKVRVAIPNLVPGDVLTPYISIQKPEIYPYTNDLNIVEVSISPQDSINEDIIAQLGSFNIDEYIGDPRLDSSDSYPALTELRNFYFKKYSDSQNIFDIIKLLSYFDNSLFKMIKDFVPAKANLSTGLVINTNILERNKIARHQPVMTFVDYSGSIDTAFITGSNGLAEIYNTAYTSSTTYTSGSITKYNTQKKELFTGELGGTVITVHSQSADNIVYELNNISVNVSSSIHDNYYRLPINPTLNNVLTARTSPQYLDVDYAYNPILPVNINYLTASLRANLNIGGFEFLNAPVQDSNYTTRGHVNSRYNGSRLFGDLYNTYSLGDISYGNSPVINLNPIKFAYFKEITSQSLTFPGRVNVNTKYIIDSASNVIELTEANANIFDLQSIFNRTNVNVALDNINQPSKQKRLNGLKPVYAGGFRYEPILQNTSNDVSYWANLAFTFLDDIAVDNPASGSQVTASINGFTLGTAYLANNIISNPNNSNISSDSLSVNINSGIIIPVTRTTAYNGEIRQRVTGSVTLTLKVSPSGDFVTKLYDNYTGTEPARWTVTGPYVNGWLCSQNPSDPLAGNGGACNAVGSIRIEPGVTLKIANHDQDPSIATYNTFTPPNASNAFSGSANNGLIRTTTLSPEVLRYPLMLNSSGLDRIEIISNGTTASFSATSPQNTFVQTPNPLVSYSQPFGDYGIEDDDGLIIQVTYPFEGLIVLDAGVFGTTDIPLKNLLGNIGNISQTITFTRTPLSSRIRFKTSPLYETVRELNGGNYYFTQAPNKIYITGSSDNGFNSGSNLTNNWYFERGNKVESGSLFTLLTASYDLSRLYYDHYVSGGNYYGNLIKQTLPDATTIIGYQPITEFFNPKKGDLIRFFNHDSDTFPFISPFEREITNIYLPNQTIGTGSNGTGSYDGRLVFEVSEYNSPNNDLPPDILNQSCINNPSGSAIGHVINFIMLSKIPDETNIVLLTEKNLGQTSPGILLPEYLNKEVKDDAANIVKRLKAQNLLDVSTTNITDVQGGGF